MNESFKNQDTDLTKIMINLTIFTPLDPGWVPWGPSWFVSIPLLRKVVF